MLHLRGKEQAIKIRYTQIALKKRFSVTVGTSWQNQVLLIRMKMGRRLLTWCFIFKLSLLLITVIEASRNIHEKNLELNERVSKIEDKDRHQDGEMTLLKNALEDERKLVHDLTNRVKILEDSNKISGRPKRPVRLLPPHILR